MSTIISKAFFKGIGFYSFFSLLTMLYLGGYYFLSKFFIFHINNYIKEHIGNDPLLVKNFYIISLIIKFIIFFLLLKIIVRSTYNYIFIDDDNDCDLYNKTDFFAGIVSVTFFVIYEFIMFPLYFVDGLDKLLEFIITDIKKYTGGSNSTNKILDVIKKDIHKLTTKDIENILLKFYTTEYETITNNPSVFVYILQSIVSGVSFIMEQLGYPINIGNGNNADVFSIANKLGSTVAGNTVIYLIILFTILIAVYKYVKSGFLSIICYIIIAILFMTIMYFIICKSLMKFSINASEIMIEKTISGDNLDKLVRETEEDVLKLIKDISSLNPVTKMFISKLVNSILTKMKKKDEKMVVKGEK